MEQLTFICSIYSDIKKNIMGKIDFPVTTAIRELKQKNINYVPFLYEYEEKGGTSQTAIELNVDEHNVIKTLIFNADGELIICLQHGDKEVSTKELARILKVKKVEPADQKSAQNATGYQFGGTSPFGTKKKLNIYAESTIFDLEKIYINGGKRGYILEINPYEIENNYSITKVSVAI